MAQVTLPNTITAGETATAADVQENFEALRDGVNDIDDTQIGTGVIGTAHLADEAVTASKLADGAVGTTQLATGAVATANIDNATITSEKIDTTDITLVLHQVLTAEIGGEDEEDPTANVGTFQFSDLDPTLMPTLTVYWEDKANPNQWVSCSSNTTDVTVRSHFQGDNFVVTVTNEIDTTPDSREFTVVVIGAAA